MRILTVNSGSSSIKFSRYHIREGREELLSRGSVEGIGFITGLFRVRDGSGNEMAKKELSFRDHAAALLEITAWLDSAGKRTIDAVGHRVVHGGSSYGEPHLIEDTLLAGIEALVPFAPDHLPHELAAIRELRRVFPDLPQVACFDTAFHRTMPDVAQRYALPEAVLRHGVLRYGFHGLSYEYILNELKTVAGPEAAGGKVIVAHLGNGASMGAFRNGTSRDTTMGFTPAGGLVMSTRSGDLDPGVIVYLSQEKGMDAAGLNRLVNKEAGLLGISGTSPDMKELLAQEATDPRAAAAVELFCYQAKKYLGALAAILDGLDTLVFTGGIGENAALVRERICAGLEFLGVTIDEKRNHGNEPVISRDNGRVNVRVMQTNEELMIARHTERRINTDRREPCL